MLYYLQLVWRLKSHAASLDGSNSKNRGDAGAFIANRRLKQGQQTALPGDARSRRGFIASRRLKQDQDRDEREQCAGVAGFHREQAFEASMPTRRGPASSEVSHLIAPVRSQPLELPLSLHFFTPLLREESREAVQWKAFRRLSIALINLSTAPSPSS